MDSGPIYDLTRSVPGLVTEGDQTEKLGKRNVKHLIQHAGSATKLVILRHAADPRAVSFLTKIKAPRPSIKIKSTGQQIQLRSERMTSLSSSTLQLHQEIVD